MKLVKLYSFQNDLHRRHTKLHTRFPGLEAPSEIILCQKVLLTSVRFLPHTSPYRLKHSVAVSFSFTQTP